MRAIDLVITKNNNAKIEVRKDGDNFSASLVIGNMDFITTVDKSVDKAMWELNGAIVERGACAIRREIELI